mmetsp:Transcript_78394/g.123517  ORF Transcript_78394/g.123517 Transcript_78394/m.123517 type:complete len:129 (+) Transcript_78394:62-448(+)
MFCVCCDGKAEGPVEEVAALPTLAEAAEKVSSATKAESVPAAAVGAVFTFKLPDGTVKEVDFQQKPLGLDFSKSIPMMVKAVKKDSVAEEANIQAKWMVTHVKGEEMPNDLKEAMTTILKAVKDLPQR